MRKQTEKTDIRRRRSPL